MTLEPSNAKCPRCGSSKMFFLVGDDGYFQSVFQMKCINCNSYFTVKQVFGETEMTAPPKLTNADSIRAMSDEELAKWFGNLIYPECVVCPADDNGWCGDESCTRNWLDWLTKEAEE